jgi:hypothetical protein
MTERHFERLPRSADAPIWPAHNEREPHSVASFGAQVGGSQSDVGFASNMAISGGEAAKTVTSRTKAPDAGTPK